MHEAGWKAKVKMHLGLQRYQELYTLIYER